MSYVNAARLHDEVPDVVDGGPEVTSQLEPEALLEVQQPAPHQAVVVLSDPTKIQASKPLQQVKKARRLKSAVQNLRCLSWTHSTKAYPKERKKRKFVIILNHFKFKTKKYVPRKF
jgi:hypothetical protein